MKTLFTPIILLLLFCLFTGNSSKHKSVRIALITSAGFPKEVYKNIKKEVMRVYGLRIDSVGMFVAPKDSTYLDESLIDSIKEVGVSKRFDVVVGLTKAKIVDVWAFYSDGAIYGYTNREYKKSVVSDYLLRFDSAYVKHITNVSLHEIGHLLGLNHCGDTNCIMTAFDGLDDTDLCTYCFKVYQAIKNGQTYNLGR